MIHLVDITLISLVVAVALAIIRLRSMLAVTMLSGIYSLLMACIFTVLDAVDVAFTEAAVGAGISTVLALAALGLTDKVEKKPTHGPRILPLLAVAVTGGLLLFAVPDMPAFGDAAAPIHHHVAPWYIETSVPQTTVPNYVTAILAAYRGYDTLGETFVIFTAGIAVILLLGSRQRRTSANSASRKD